jgi:hypothetical protein
VEGPASGSKKSRADDLVAVAACVAIGFFLFHLVLFRYGRDQGIYAVVGDALLHGRAPYRDAWDFKPPGIFFVYALARALFGASEHAVRILEALLFVTLVWAFTILSKRFSAGWRAGLVAGALAVGTEAQLEFWHTSQPESFGAVVLAWALVLATYIPDASDPKRARKELFAWAGAGALYAAAALFKPPLGGGFVVSLGFVIARRWRDEDRTSIARAILDPTLAFSAGASLLLAIVLGYFASKGALHDLYETLFVFTPHYTKLSFQPEWFWGFVYMAFEQWSVGFSAFLACGLALFLALPRLHDDERLGATHVIGVVVFQLFGVALQAKFFPYHYGAALPLGALLAGWGAWKVWVRARENAVAIGGVVVLLYVLGDSRGATRDLEDTFWGRCKMRWAAFRDPALRDETNDYLYSVADVNAGANRQTAAYLAEMTKPDESVFVWGFEPEMYDLARRRPATRYVYNVAQRVPWGLETREILMSDLAKDKPAAIVVEHRDVFPAVTGNRLDSADTLNQFQPLAQLIRGEYRLATTIEDFDVYLRRLSIRARSPDWDSMSHLEKSRRSRASTVEAPSTAHGSGRSRWRSLPPRDDSSASSPPACSARAPRRRWSAGRAARARARADTDRSPSPTPTLAHRPARCRNAAPPLRLGCLSRHPDSPGTCGSATRGDRRRPLRTRRAIGSALRTRAGSRGA